MFDIVDIQTALNSRLGGNCAFVGGSRPPNSNNPVNMYFTISCFGLP